MNKQDLDKLKNRLTQQVTDNPLLSVGVFAAAATAASKLMEANTDRRRAKTHDREVRRREELTYRQPRKK